MQLHAPQNCYHAVNSNVHIYSIVIDEGLECVNRVVLGVVRVLLRTCSHKDDTFNHMHQPSDGSDITHNRYGYAVYCTIDLHAQYE